MRGRASSSRWLLFLLVTLAFAYVVFFLVALAASGMARIAFARVDADGGDEADNCGHICLTPLT